MTENVNDQIRNIIIETLEGGDCTRQVLLEKIYQSLPAGKPVSLGVISGVIKGMTEYGDLNIINRGVYRKGDGMGNADLQSKVNRLVNRFRSGLDGAYTVNLLHMKACDKDFIVKIQSIVKQFDTDIKAAYADYNNSINYDMDQEYPVSNKQDTSDFSKGTIKEVERK